MSCKVLSGFQRFRRYRHKTFSLKDFKVLDKKIKALCQLVFTKKELRSSEKASLLPFSLNVKPDKYYQSATESLSDPVETTIKKFKNYLSVLTIKQNIS